MSRASGAKARPAATKARSAAGSTRARGTGAAKAARGAASKAKTSSASAAPDARLEAVAQRLRKLNERIIDAGKEAGESTLTSYEKALKAIANGIEKGPGRSDIDWISHFFTSQAKFIRDMSDSLTAVARERLK